MCFDVNSKAKRWKNKTVYKVVARAKVPGRTSPYYISPMTGNPVLYTYLEETVASPGEAKHYAYTYRGKKIFKSKHGIYVLKTVKAARRFANLVGYTNHEAYTILELIVDPKDFIHQAARSTKENTNTSATYRKVRSTAVVYSLSE